MRKVASSAGTCRTAGGRAARRLLLFGMVWFALCLGIGLWSLGQEGPGAPRQLRGPDGPRLQALRQRAFLAVLERAAAGVPHARLYQEPRSGADDVLQYVMEGVRAPLRLALKLLVNTLLGFLALWAVNLTAGVTGVALGFNLWNALVIGVLGLPGFLLLLLTQWVL